MCTSTLYENEQFTFFTRVWYYLKTKEIVSYEKKYFMNKNCFIKNKSHIQRLTENVLLDVKIYEIAKRHLVST